jgi:hypothetical protein
MTALEILTDLRRAGTIVTIAGDKLRLEAPKGVLTDELKQRLATQKAEIIMLLQSETSTACPDGQAKPRCSYCSMFRPIGHEAGCSKPGDPNVSMTQLLGCPAFAAKTVH